MDVCMTSYTSAGARLLQRVAAEQTSRDPQAVVWTPDTGWTDQGKAMVPERPQRAHNRTGA